MKHPSKIEGIKEFNFDCKQAYIYFLVDINDVVVYVGQSHSFLGRYAAHKITEKTSTQWVEGKIERVESHLKEFNRCFILSVEKDSLDYWEQHFLRVYLPIYNTCHHSKKIRKEIDVEYKTIKKFIWDNNLNYEIERNKDKWYIQKEGEK